MDKLSRKAEGIDIGYWESLLSELKAHMARARLRDRHQENLKKKLNILIQEQGVEKLETATGSDPEKIDPETTRAKFAQDL